VPVRGLSYDKTGFAAKSSPADAVEPNAVIEWFFFFQNFFTNFFPNFVQKKTEQGNENGKFSRIAERRTAKKIGK